MIPKTMGKRGPVLSGRVPQELYDSAMNLIDGLEFKTMNDVVEAAIWHLINDRQKTEGIEGGESVGN